MGVTTDWSLPYPDSTDAPEVWADMQALADALDLVLTDIATKPICKLVQTVAQALSSGVDTVLTFTAAGSEIYDASGWHNTAVNTGRITPNVSGHFNVKGHLFLDTPGSGISYTQLGVAFFKNGSIINPRGRFGAPSATNVSASAGHSTKIDLNGSTDYVEVQGSQLASTPGTKNTIVGSSFVSSFELEFLG
jgi:hypothetical protein